MKKLLLLLFTIVMATSGMIAQRMVHGTVTDDSGSPLIGASVVVKGNTNLGTITDIDGKFQLKVGPNAKTLVVSYIGYTTKEVELGTSDEVNVTLSSGVQLEDVVVTALGIKRDKNALGYAVQDVKSDKIEKSVQTSILDALQGKIAGVRINKASGEAGASTFMEIRGSSSITRNNQPLFVVDGVPIDNSGNSENTVDGVAESNRAMDINPNDVESISILKGGAATALYGMRAANGAVIITTKSGKNTHGKIKVHVNSALKIDNVSKLPPLQKTYAQGSNIWMGFYDRTGLWMPDEQNYTGVSWGPKLEDLRYTTDPNYVPGNEYVKGGLTPMNEWMANWDPNGRLVPADSPYATDKRAIAYDHYNFFRTAYSYNNYFDITGGNDKNTFFLSFGNDNNNGVVPNNTFDKNSFKLSASTKLSDKFTVSASANYIRTEGERKQKGSNISGIMLGLMRTPPNFDNSFKYQLPDLSQRTYRGGGGYDNPYWVVNKISYHDVVNRVLGNVNLNYKFNDWLTFNYKIGTDFWAKDVKNFFEKGSNGNPDGYDSESTALNQDFNADFTAIINKRLNDNLGFRFMVGNNMYQYKYTSTYATAYGLAAYDTPNLINSSDVKGGESNSMKRTAAWYGDLSFDFMHMLYLGATGRYEWSTTLPEKNNSFFYPSVSLGFIFSEIPAIQDLGFLSFGKFRASYAQIANDASLYATKNYYYQVGPGDGWTNGLTFPFLNENAFTVGTVIGNDNLKPENQKTTEVGLELKFLDNRFGIDFAWFKNRNEDLLLSVPIAPSTGYGYQYLNAGTMETKGIELIFNATPVKTSDFRWDLSLNWSNPKTDVISLAEGVPNVFLGGFTEPQVRAVVGSPYRSLFGLRWTRDANGNILINDDPNDNFMDGFPFSDPELQEMGSVQPDWVGGLSNSFTWKNLTISALLQMKKGGLMWNGTKGALYFFGTHADTENRGEEKVWTGVMGHIDADGDVAHYDANGDEVKGPGDVNTQSVVVDEDWYWWSGEGSGFTGPSEPYVEDSGWLRLREITVSYSLKNLLKKTLITNAEVYFTGTNLWLKTDYTGVDPETSLTGNSNGQGIDYFNNPGTKSMAFGLKLTF